MKLKFTLAALTLAFAATAASADAIEGMWARPNGILVKISACGSAFCVTAASGPHAGGSAGKMSPAGDGKYSGTVTDLEANKTYTGNAKINGNTLRMSGCIMGGLLCKGENWARK